MATNDILSPKVMLGAVEKIPINRNYIGLSLLPMREVEEDELTWDVIKDEQNLAGVYAVNGEIKPGFEAIIQQMFADVCRLGSSRVLDEQTIRVLRDAGMVGVTTGVAGSMRRRAERKVAKSLQDCNREVDATVEYLIINAMRGYISWPPPMGGTIANMPQFGAASLSIDYNFPSDHKVRATDLTTAYYWSDTANADVVDNLEEIAVTLTDDAGVDTSDMTIIMSRHALRWMAQHSQLTDILRYTSSGFLNFGNIQSYFETVLGWRFRIYDAQYTWRETSATDLNDITIHRHRYLPTNYAIIYPTNLRIGDFASSPSKANNWRPGKFAWNEENTNPWTTEIGVGLNGFPRLEHPEAIFVLQIAEDPTGLSDS